MSIATVVGRLADSVMLIGREYQTIGEEGRRKSFAPATLRLEAVADILILSRDILSIMKGFLEISVVPLREKAPSTRFWVQDSLQPLIFFPFDNGISLPRF